MHEPFQQLVSDMNTGTSTSTFTFFKHYRRDNEIPVHIWIIRVVTFDLTSDNPGANIPVNPPVHINFQTPSGTRPLRQERIEQPFEL